MLTDWFLPGTKAGGPVRSIYSLTALLKDYYDFYIITRNTDLGSDIPYRDIKANAFFESEGIHYYYVSESALKKNAVIEVIRNIDPGLIYLNSAWSLPFSVNVLRAKKEKLVNASVLLAPRGMLSKGALGLKSFKKISFLAVARMMKWYSGITFHATNDDERRDILRQFKNARVLVAPNINSGKVYSLKKPKTKNHVKLFYLSRISRVKNLHLALDALKQVSSEHSIEYDIYGNIEDATYWEHCKEIINELPRHIRVNYRQELQFNEVQAIIVSYHALLLPTLNENFGHSIVESLLCGCPVVISDQTPWSDVKDLNAGYALPLDDLRAFTSAVEQLSSLDQDEYDKASAAAIRYISGKLNIESTIKQYKSIFDEAIKN